MKSNDDLIRIFARDFMIIYQKIYTEDFLRGDDAYMPGTKRTKDYDSCLCEILNHERNNRGFITGFMTHIEGMYGKGEYAKAIKVRLNKDLAAYVVEMYACHFQTIYAEALFRGNDTFMPRNERTKDYDSFLFFILNLESKNPGFIEGLMTCIEDNYGNATKFLFHDDLSACARQVTKDSLLMTPPGSEKRAKKQQRRIDSSVPVPAGPYERDVVCSFVEDKTLGFVNRDADDADDADDVSDISDGLNLQPFSPLPLDLAEEFAHDRFPEKLKDDALQVPSASNSSDGSSDASSLGRRGIEEDQTTNKRQRTSPTGVLEGNGGYFTRSAARKAAEESSPSS